MGQQPPPKDGAQIAFRIFLKFSNKKVEHWLARGAQEGAKLGGEVTNPHGAKQILGVFRLLKCASEQRFLGVIPED